jgi:hypothetical protein
MGFKPGNKLGKGRPKGAFNQRTLQFREVLEKNNFCPASAMIEIYTEAKKIYEGYAVIFEAIVNAKSNEQGFPAIVEDKADKYLKIAGDMAKELGSYTYAKRKSVESTVDPELLQAIEALKDKSDEELLTLLKDKGL